MTDKKSKQQRAWPLNLPAAEYFFVYKGDLGTTSVSMKKTGPNTLEETDKRDGKVIADFCSAADALVLGDFILSKS